MFANNLTDREITLKLYDTTSIGTIKRDNDKGVPAGKNKLKNLRPCKLTENIFNVATKDNPKKNVTAKLVVKAETPEIIPVKFINKINVK